MYTIYLDLPTSNLNSTASFFFFKERRKPKQWWTASRISTLFFVLCWEILSAPPHACSSSPATVSMYTCHMVLFLLRVTQKVPSISHNRAGRSGSQFCSQELTCWVVAIQTWLLWASYTQWGKYSTLGMHCETLQWIKPRKARSSFTVEVACLWKPVALY